MARMAGPGAIGRGRVDGTVAAVSAVGMMLMVMVSVSGGNERVGAATGNGG
jgi:hypothetical protein